MSTAGQKQLLPFLFSLPLTLQLCTCCAPIAFHSEIPKCKLQHFVLQLEPRVKRHGFILFCLKAKENTELDKIVLIRQTDMFAFDKQLLDQAEMLHLQKLHGHFPSSKHLKSHHTVCKHSLQLLHIVADIFILFIPRIHNG